MNKDEETNSVTIKEDVFTTYGLEWSEFKVYLGSEFFGTYDYEYRAKAIADKITKYVDNAKAEADDKLNEIMYFLPDWIIENGERHKINIFCKFRDSGFSYEGWYVNFGQHRSFWGETILIAAQKALKYVYDNHSQLFSDHSPEQHINIIKLFVNLVEQKGQGDE